MKISNETMAVLHNFASINAKLLVPAGNTILTITPEDNVMAKMITTETFPVEFGVLDLNRFMSSISLFKDPDFNFQARCLEYGEGNSTITQNYADKSILFERAEKNPYIKGKIDMPDMPIKFSLTKEQWSDANKAASTLQIPDLSFVTNGDNIDLVVSDRRNPSSDRFVVNKVGDSNGQEFKAYFKLKYLRLLPGNYDVAISKANLAHFVYKDNIDLQYWVGVDSDSTYKTT